jgi:hypothetical protein
MPYDFDPTHWDGTIFDLADYEFGDDILDYKALDPIPADQFPKKLMTSSRFVMPDIFHTTRSKIIVSSRAREVMEPIMTDEIGYIVVRVEAHPDCQYDMELADDYYFINVLGRAQRIDWTKTPARLIGKTQDGRDRMLSENDRTNWWLRDRKADDPIIWLESVFDTEKATFRGGGVFIEDEAWLALNARFPGQLNALMVGAKTLR